MQLMGGPPISAAASKNLPMPDMISSPRAAIVLALAGYDARGMPGLEGLLQGEKAVRVKDDYADGAYPVHPFTTSLGVIIAKVDLILFG